MFFAGAVMVFTNVINPRADFTAQRIPEHARAAGTTIGANATILSGITLGEIH